MNLVIIINDYLSTYSFLCRYMYNIDMTDPKDGEKLINKLHGVPVMSRASDCMVTNHNLPFGCGFS